MTELEKKQNVVLLDLISNEMFGAGKRITLNSEEMECTFTESKEQAVGAIAFDALPQEFEKLNFQIYQEWQQFAFCVIQRNLRITVATAALSEILSQNKIKHGILKGCTSSIYYLKPNLRQMGDIDFIVAKEDKERTLFLLLENGFIKTGKEHSFHIALTKEDILYELHTQVGSVPKGQEYVFDLIKDNISLSEEKNLCGFKFMAPDTFHHGMIILFHMQRHIEMCEGIGLRHLCDWAAFINSLSNDEFTTLFETKLKSIGMWKFAKIMGQTAHLFLGMPQKEWLQGIDDNICKAMIEDILEGGTFGHKDKSRTQTAVFINRGTEEKSEIKVIMTSLKYKIGSCYPFFKKHNCLLPLGFLIYSIRIGFFLIFRKNNLNIHEVILKGNKRNFLYQQCGFFEKK